jgi:hypothetical protein
VCGGYKDLLRSFAKRPGLPPQADVLGTAGSRGVISAVQLLVTLSSKRYNRSRGITPADIGRASWLKSSFSNYNGSCFEVSRLSPDRIGVRDTKDNGFGPVLVFTSAEWSAFVAGAKSGQFDKL